MSSGSAQPRTKSVSALYRHTLSTTSSSQPVVELRRSQRSHRPSLHKRESDEYRASSQESSRPPSPSQPISKLKSKKDPQGKRGDRPGRIIQPDDDAWAACDSSSPEPLAKSGSPPSDPGMAEERAARDNELEIKIISKAEAIRRVSAHLGYDATRMPNSILKEVLAEMPTETQADPSSPMEAKGGTAPALLQSADRMVLGYGPQPSAGGTPDMVAVPQEPEPRLVYPEALPNADSATEPESEPEVIELGPEDSVSQQVPQPIYPLPLPSRPVPTPVCHAARHAGNAKRSTSDTATIDESDATHDAKWPRLIPPRVARSPLASTSYTRTHTSASTPRISSSTRRTPTRTVASSGHVVLPAIPTPRSSLSSSLLNPPPVSDIDAVLAWATQLATKAASSRMVS